MGASVSTNVSETTTRITNNISNSQRNIATVQAEGTNSFSITNNKCGGDMRVGVDQSNEAKVDMKQVAMGMTDQSIQNQMAAQLKQAAVAANRDLNLLQVSVSTNVTSDVQETTTNIVNEITNECGGKINQSNKLIVSDNKVLGDCVFEVAQTNKSLSSLDCVQSAVANSTAVSEAQRVVDQSASATNTGIDIVSMITDMMWPIAIVLIAFIFAFAYSIPKILDHIAGQNSAVSKLVAIPALSAIGSVVFVILFFVVKQDVVRMRRSAFSNMCEGVPAGEVQNPRSETADDAIDTCKQDPNCKAVAFTPSATTLFADGEFDDCKPTSAIPQTIQDACNTCEKAKPCDGAEECPACYCDVKTVWEIDQWGDVVRRQGPPVLSTDPDDPNFNVPHTNICGKKWCDNKGRNKCRAGETPSLDNKGECGVPTLEEDGTLNYGKGCCICEGYKGRPSTCLEDSDQKACARCAMGVSQMACRTGESGKQREITNYFKKDSCTSNVYDCVMNDNCDGCQLLGDRDILVDNEGMYACGMQYMSEEAVQANAMAIKRTEKTHSAIFIWFALGFMVISMVSAIAIARTTGTKSARP